MIVARPVPKLIGIMIASFGILIALATYEVFVSYSLPHCVINYYKDILQKVVLVLSLAIAHNVLQCRVVSMPHYCVRKASCDR